MCRGTLIFAFASLVIGALVHGNPEEEFIPNFTIPEVDENDYFSSLVFLKSEDLTRIGEVDFLKFRYEYLIIRYNKRLSVPSPLEKRFNQEMNKKEPDNELLTNLCNQISNYDYTDQNRRVMRYYFLAKQSEDVSVHT